MKECAVQYMQKQVMDVSFWRGRGEEGVGRGESGGGVLIVECVLTRKRFKSLVSLCVNGIHSLLAHLGSRRGGGGEGRKGEEREREGRREGKGEHDRGRLVM